MKTIRLGCSTLQVPVVAAGCMRLNELDAKEAEGWLRNALEQGVNFFDHADIYGGGDCERLFANAVKAAGVRREDMVIQSKCGIKPGEFDFAKPYILQAVDGILQRLGTDYLDVLLLHRPDALMEPDEVAEAFGALQSSGKVRWFGVSNQNPGTMALLQQALPQRIVANQLQFSVTNSGMVRSAMNVNQENPDGIVRDSDVLNYCRLNGITVQAWSPFQHGMFAGTFIGNPDYAPLNDELEKLAKKYGVTKGAIAVAWILRHPAKMQVLVGTVHTGHFNEACAAAGVCLTHKEWYDVFLAAGNQLP